MNSKQDFFFKPVDIASLVFFRIAFGMIMAIEVLRYFLHGWIGQLYIEPALLFKYYGFEWVDRLPGIGMYVVFAVLGVLAICITVGLYYRLCSALFFLLFSYVFLLDQAVYLNHFYLLILISLLMPFLPANRSLSIDCLRRSSLCSNEAPAWSLWILRFQIAMPYFYGGIAKLNGDWLRGEPLRTWLSRRTDFPIVGEYFTEEWAVYFFTYGGLLFDLLVVPLLLWKRTRILAFCAAVFFNVTNIHLFNIGIFPWFMLVGTLMFFAPSWPRTLLRQAIPRAPTPQHSAFSPKGMITFVLGAYVMLQLLIPLRHFLYPGNVNWTLEGHRFSWRMKLNEHETHIMVAALDHTAKQSWHVDPRTYLAPHQHTFAFTRPDMLLQLAHTIADDFRSKGYADIQVHMSPYVSLNGRDLQLLVHPTVDLAKIRRSLAHSEWILPLDPPIRAKDLTQTGDDRT